MKILAALFLVLTPLSVQATERRYTVTDFDRIQVEGPFRVRITTGGTSHAAASGDIHALDRIVIDTQGQTLRIRAQKAGGEVRDTGPVDVAVTTRTLRGVVIIGSADVVIQSVKALKFDLALAGNGRADLGGLAADVLAVTLRGGGTARLAGSAKSFSATVEGSASLDGADLQADDIRLASDSTGTIAMNARRSAAITAVGAGDVTISGKPACTVKTLGSGRVTCGAAR